VATQWFFFGFLLKKRLFVSFLRVPFPDGVVSPCVAGVPQQSRFPPKHTLNLTTSQPHFRSKLDPPAPSSSKFFARVMLSCAFHSSTSGVAADAPGGCRRMRAALLPCRRGEEPVGIFVRYAHVMAMCLVSPLRAERAHGASQHWPREALKRTLLQKR
jgi:hypothetical protein